MLLLYSCNNDQKDPNFESANGKIIDAGSEASDGCGWILILEDASTYKPDEIPEEYREDNLKVNVVYRKLEETVYCGFPAGNVPEYSKIELKKIKKL